jgi:P27 family predicted phage terminase small subunit
MVNRHVLRNVAPGHRRSRTRVEYGGRGPRDIPIALASLRGVRGQDQSAFEKVAAAEGKWPAMTSTDPPPRMRPAAQLMWRELTADLESFGMLKVTDRPALEACCECYADLVTARASLGEGPHLSKGKRPHPAFTVISECDRRLRLWLIEFGMTPSARVGVIARQEGSASPPPCEPPCAEPGAQRTARLLSFYLSGALPLRHGEQACSAQRPSRSPPFEDARRVWRTRPTRHPYCIGVLTRCAGRINPRLRRWQRRRPSGQR